MTKKRPTDPLFGNLLDEFGDAAAPVIRKVLSALGVDADPEIVRKAVQQRAAKAPAAKKPKAKAANKPKAITQTPDLRAMSTEKAIKTARKKPHLIQDKTGQYVGAPRGVTTRGALNAMRANFDRDVAAGAEGADWYTRARASNVELAGPDPKKQRLLAQEQALWSAQANPDTNLNFALQGHNAYEMGSPLDLVRTGQQARTYREARDAGVDIPLGKKTGIYGMHLDPTSPYATTGTNDIWHARGFGYTNADGEQFSRALSDQEHRFLDYETMLAVDRANKARLAGRDDWVAHEIQAAPWVAGKGRGLAQQIAGKGNTPTEEQLAEGMRRAAMTYPDYLPKYTANATYELVPYSQSGHLSGVGAGDEAVRARYSSEPELSWMDENQRDIIYDALGAYQLPTRRATGVYTPPGGEREINQAFVGSPLVGLTGGDVDPMSRDMLNLAEMTRGYFGGQGASAWNMGIKNAPAREQGSVLIPLSNPADADTLEALGKMGEAYGLPDFMDVGDAAILTNFENTPSGVTTGASLRSGLADEIAALTGTAPERFKSTGSYLPILEKGEAPGQGVPGSGYATDQLLAMADKYPVAGAKISASPALRARVGAGVDVDERYAAEGFGATREDIQTARRIFAEKGLEGLREARRSGIALPGVLAFMSLYGLQDDDGSEGY